MLRTYWNILMPNLLCIPILPWDQLMIIWTLYANAIAMPRQTYLLLWCFMLGWMSIPVLFTLLYTVPAYFTYLKLNLFSSECSFIKKPSCLSVIYVKLCKLAIHIRLLCKSFHVKSVSPWSFPWHYYISMFKHLLTVP